MKKLDAQTKTLLTQKEPGFIRAVVTAKKEQTNYIALSILGFAAESEAKLLHTCLRYAYEQGIAVIFAPEGAKSPEHTVGDMSDTTCTDKKGNPITVSHILENTHTGEKFAVRSMFELLEQAEVYTEKHNRNLFQDVIVIGDIYRNLDLLVDLGLDDEE